MLHRPTYHFLPPRNWMNDPNGLIFWRGQYHLFYQWNPGEARWGNIHWGHGVSDDLLHWQHLPLALAPTDTFDSSGCWSGCAVADGDELKLFYTAARDYNPLTDTSNIQLRLASSRDGIHFVKHPQPLVSWSLGDSFGEVEPIGFRDPWVWREGNLWKMLVGSGSARGGCALLFEGESLEAWRYIGPILQADELLVDFDLGTVWECPQLLFFEDKAVLTFSVWRERKGLCVAYISGRWDGGRLHPEKVDVLERSNFYAPQSLKDAQGRWLMWGWLYESRPVEEQIQAGWSGAMSLPRVLGLQDGRLTQNPPTELRLLRGESREWANLSLSEVPLDLGQIDGSSELSLRVRLGAVRQLELCMASGEIEQIVLRHDRSSQSLTLDRSKSSLEATNDLSELRMPLEAQTLELQVFIDQSVIEVFAGGRALSGRVYPSTGFIPRLSLKADGQAELEHLRLWRMNNIWQ